MIGVIIPTFQRPHALENIARNVHENTNEHQLYFVCEPTDQASIDEVTRLKEHLILNKYPGSHTGAANTAYEATTEPFFIIANDDFNFIKGWDTAALKKMTPGIGVVGLNDGATTSFTQITLVRRAYIDEFSGCVDIPGVLYFPGYNHNFVDTEFSEVAMSRNAFTTCPESVVEHLHWSFGKSHKDQTYDKSLSTASKDQQTYNSRKHLWTH